MIYGNPIFVEAHPEKENLRLSTINGEPITADLLLLPGLDRFLAEREIDQSKVEKMEKKHFNNPKKKNKRNRGKRF